MREKNVKKLEIIYEEESYLVCKKAAGMAVQSAKAGQMDMESMIRNELVKRRRGGEIFLGVIHRLDQPVEGIMVFAKTKDKAAFLNRELTQGNFEKIYLAVIRGTLKETSGRLENYMKKDNRANISKIVPKGESGAKKAVLDYEVLETIKGDDGKDLQLVKIHLLTGRHHQIRLQFANVGCPLMGDAKYGQQTEAVEKKSGYSQLCLCAAKLSFRPAKGEERKSFYCQPTAEVFQKFVTIQSHVNA